MDLNILEADSDRAKERKRDTNKKRRKLKNMQACMLGMLPNMQICEKTEKLSTVTQSHDHIKFIVLFRKNKIVFIKRG